MPASTALASLVFREARHGEISERYRQLKGVVCMGEICTCNLVSRGKGMQIASWNKRASWPEARCASATHEKSSDRHGGRQGGFPLMMPCAATSCLDLDSFRVAALRKAIPGKLCSAFCRVVESQPNLRGSP